MDAVAAALLSVVSGRVLTWRFLKNVWGDQLGQDDDSSSASRECIDAAHGLWACCLWDLALVRRLHYDRRFSRPGRPRAGAK